MLQATNNFRQLPNVGSGHAASRSKGGSTHQFEFVCCPIFAQVLGDISIREPRSSNGEGDPSLKRDI